MSNPTVHALLLAILLVLCGLFASPIILLKNLGGSILRNLVLALKAIDRSFEEAGKMRNELSTIPLAAPCDGCGCEIGQIIITDPLFAGYNFNPDLSSMSFMLPPIIVCQQCGRQISS